MDMRPYPGQGLSLSQLIFAMNEELKRVAYSPFSTLDVVSRLDQDASSALAMIREWRNSLVLINRIPLDVLSLIPTYLSSRSDIFRVSSVCRHWRRTFIQRATLWSQFYLTRSKADLYAKTFLERSKGSALDITARGPITTDPVRVETLALLSPHAQRVGSLDFLYGYWSDIQEFSKAVSGPLPLLRILKINVVYDHHRPVMTPPLLPLFTGAVNLKEFSLRSEGLPFLDRFIFPNLTTLKLSTMPARGGFPTLQLLNFLEASPALRTVHIRVEVTVLLGGVPQGRVVVLPNVETFYLSVGEYEPGYKIAAHISCPSARLTSLLYEQDADNSMSLETFPTSATWDAIARQYSANPADEVILEIMTAQDPIIACFLTFLSPGPAVLGLGFKVTSDYDDDEEFEMTLGERHVKILSRAFMTIRTHPLLANVKRLRIQDNQITLDSNELAQITSEVKQLFKSVGPLDALTLDVSDLRPYLASFLEPPESCDATQPDGFPPIKELMITQPSWAPAIEECLAAIAELEKSQHALGMPFERVVTHVSSPPPETAEWLQQWTGAVH